MIKVATICQTDQSVKTSEVSNRSLVNKQRSYDQETQQTGQGYSYGEV